MSIKAYKPDEDSETSGQVPAKGITEVSVTVTEKEEFEPVSEEEQIQLDRERREREREESRARRRSEERNKRREQGADERKEERSEARNSRRENREERQASRTSREDREPQSRKETEEQSSRKSEMKINLSNAFVASRNNERVNKFIQLQTQWKKNNEANVMAKMLDEVVKTFPIPGMENVGPVSILATCGQFPNDDTFYYALILVENRETTVREMTRRSNDRRGRDRDEIREFLSLGEQLDDKTIAAVEDAICNLHSKLKPENLQFTGFVVLSHAVQLETVDNILPILGTSVDYVLTASGNTMELVNKDIKDDGIRLEGIIGIVGTSDVTGYNGLPIRNDVSISLETSTQGNNRSISLIDNNSQAQWATASAYVDLIPVESPDGSREDRSKDHNLACLIPRVIYSEVDVYREEETAGPMVRSMIAMAVGVNLDKSYRYFKAFMPSAFGSRDRDIRNLGYLMDPMASVEPGKLDIENPDDDQAVFEALKRLIRHSWGMEFAYRYSEGQPGSAFGELLRDIYEDKDDDARDHLFDLLDLATGNRFTEAWDDLKGRDVIANAINLPDGHYMTNNGIQPVTRLDHWFAAEKFQDRDQARLDDFIKVHSTSSNMNADERIGMALDLYKHLSGDTFKMTGIATLLILDPIFMEACYKAFANSAMELQINRDRDEIRGRRGERTGANYGLRFDSIRGTDRRRDSGRDSRRGERTRSRSQRW